MLQVNIIFFNSSNHVPNNLFLRSLKMLFELIEIMSKSSGMHRFDVIIIDIRISEELPCRCIFLYYMHLLGGHA